MKTAQYGLTLIEACAALAIASILAGSALPSFRASQERRQLEGVASELAADLQFARTEAVARNQGVRVSFGADESGGSCYVIHTGAADSCACTGSGPAVCEAGSDEIKTVILPADRALRVRANVESMLYDPVRATVTRTGS